MKPKNKRIAIILGSSRHDGHTKQVANRLGDNLPVCFFNLLDYNIGPYRYDHGHSDDFLSLMDELINFDVWILATPVYWYSMSGTMKIFLDRWTDMLKIRKDLGRGTAGKYLAWLSCGSEKEEVPGFDQPFKLTAGYMDMNYVGGCHTWMVQAPINDEVVKKIEGFAGQLKEL